MQLDCIDNHVPVYIPEGELSSLKIICRSGLNFLLPYSL